MMADRIRPASSRQAAGRALRWRPPPAGCVPRVSFWVFVYEKDTLAGYPAARSMAGFGSAPGLDEGGPRLLALLKPGDPLPRPTCSAPMGAGWGPGAMCRIEASGQQGAWRFQTADRMDRGSARPSGKWRHSGVGLRSGSWAANWANRGVGTGRRVTRMDVALVDVRMPERGTGRLRQHRGVRVLACPSTLLGRLFRRSTPWRGRRSRWAPVTGCKLGLLRDGGSARPTPKKMRSTNVNAIELQIPDRFVQAIAERVADLLADVPERLSAPEPWIGVGEAAEHLACPTSRIYDLVS
jgi:hypothetical protein